MEKKHNHPDTTALRESLVSDPNAYMRINIENPKRQVESVKIEGDIKQYSMPHQ